MKKSQNLSLRTHYLSAIPTRPIGNVLPFEFSVGKFSQRSKSLVIVERTIVVAASDRLVFGTTTLYASDANMPRKSAYWRIFEGNHPLQIMRYEKPATGDVWVELQFDFLTGNFWYYRAKLEKSTQWLQLEELDKSLPSQAKLL